MEYGQAELGSAVHAAVGKLGKWDESEMAAAQEVGVAAASAVCA